MALEYAKKGSFRMGLFCLPFVNNKHTTSKDDEGKEY
jgi:hypothetical protein